jgi:hypothetical protein
MYLGAGTPRVVIGCIIALGQMRSSDDAQPSLAVKEQAR